MALISTGNDFLKLTLQAGSEFITTQSGFDTGTRIVKVDVSKALELEPAIGTADSEITYFTPSGLTKGVHPWMFVTSCVEVAEEAGVVTMRILFAGQKLKPGQSLPKNLKPAHLESGNEQIQIDAGGTQITLALPVIQKSYLATNFATLEPMNSPVDAPDGVPEPSLTFEGLTLPTPAYAGWRITNRQHGTAGRVGGRRIYHVQDTISYVLGI